VARLGGADALKASKVARYPAGSRPADERLAPLTAGAAPGRLTWINFPAGRPA
jgi:hypothetical protein